MISNSPGTSLELVAKMTLVNDRIDLKSARSLFDSLRTSCKIILSVQLMNSIDGYIMNNITALLDNYAHDLSAIRLGSNAHCGSYMMVSKPETAFIGNQYICFTICQHITLHRLP